MLSDTLPRCALTSTWLSRVNGHGVRPTSSFARTGSRSAGGWQPWATAGFYFELGYGLVLLGGDVTDEELVQVGEVTPEDVGLVRAEFLADVDGHEASLLPRRGAAADGGAHT